MTNLYRIGEFAEKVGVTPDWLKYYEKHGLIETQVAENGYRYFTFQQSAYITSCLELKNLGFQTEEIVNLLNGGNFHDLMKASNEKFENLKQEISFSNELLRQITFWQEAEPMFREKDNWRICTMEGFYYLPTSNRNEFVEDKRTWPIRREWSRWLPVVHSTQRILCRRIMILTSFMALQKISGGCP